MTSATPTSSQTVLRRRETLGMSRELLAANAGVSLRTVERIEAGEVEPRRATLAVIEAALAEAEAESKAVA